MPSTDKSTMTTSPPTNSLVSPLLTDLYQITMAYAYWRNNRQDDIAHFELFYRKNPFGGEYTIFAGLDEVLKHLSAFKFSSDDLAYLKSCPALSHCDAAFFDDYLANLDCSAVQLYSMKQGSVAFPRVPLMTIIAPLGIGQLLETTLLNLVNYPTLIATNAARMVVAARGQDNNSPKTDNNNGGSKKTIKMAEFGLRRAQGPDGGFSASKYSIVGGFDATSNVQAGKRLGVPIVGTHAHAFVQSYSNLHEVADVELNGERLLPRVLKYRKDERVVDNDGSSSSCCGGGGGLCWTATNDGELAAYIAYAAAFPDSFLCLIDTYDTLQSGARNFILVALVLDDLGFVPRGVRLDSGDLAYYSTACRRLFTAMASEFRRDFFHGLDIVASNDINEGALHSLTKEGHAITVFGVGTNLVTCQAQPALGCVFKLVELNGVPRMKLSQDLEKVLIPGKKIPYRLYGKMGWPLLDLMIDAEEEEPRVGVSVLCRHPFFEQKRVSVMASKVEKLHVLAFDKERGVVIPEPNIFESREFVYDQIRNMRSDILRSVEPGQYKVSVTDTLFKRLHKLWERETPVIELS